MHGVPTERATRPEKVEGPLALIFLTYDLYVKNVKAQDKPTQRCLYVITITYNRKYYIISN